MFATTSCPPATTELVELTTDPHAAPQRFLCAKRPSKREDEGATPIVVPKLARRTSDDIHRIVLEYAQDAIRELGADPTTFTERERESVVKYDATSFADIEIATLRIVMRNATGSVHLAAARLGVTHVSLGEWFKRRKL